MRRLKVILVIVGMTLLCWTQNAGAKDAVEIVIQTGHTDSVNSVAFSPNEDYIASGSSDKTIKLWEKATGNLIRTLKGHSARVNSIAFSRDGNYIVSGSNDNTVKLWEVSTGKLVKTFDDAKVIAISPDTKYIATAKLLIISLWERETGKCIKYFSADGSVSCMIFSSDDKGKYILCGTNKGINLFDTTKDSNSRKMGYYPVSCVAFSRNDNLIVSGDGDGSVRLRETETGEVIEIFKGLSNPVLSVSFSPDGKYILSVDENNTIKEWNVESRDLRTLEGHSEKVNSAAFSMDGEYIVSGGSDGTIKIWETQTKPLSWAVVIGIDGYQKFGKLSYSVKDAQAITNLLIDNFGFSKDRVITIPEKSATKQRIERLLGDELYETVTANDRVLVFFSGHGQTRETTGGKKIGYLIPIDGDPKAIHSTCISMDQISQFSDIIPAKHILFIIDACYSGLAGIVRKEGLPEETKDQIRKLIERPGRQVITAGGKDEPVVQGEKWKGHSVFTYYLLNGLEGKADSNNDKVITIHELIAYLEDKVTKDAEQTPQLRYLGDGEGQFVFYKE